VLYDQVAEDTWEKHEEAAASYVDLKWGLHDFINTSFTKRILANLKEVQDAVNEDPAINKKVLEVVEAYTKNSNNLTELFTLVKTFDFSSIKSIVESLKTAVDAQNDQLAKWAKSSTNLA
ncbi:hypothetical protein Tco_0239338, partial [Tanacetum coccineum]